MNTNRLTVKRDWLLQASTRLVRDAEESLPAWIILGQSERYEQSMRKALAMRQAADIKSISERRAYLRRFGIEA